MCLLCRSKTWIHLKILCARNASIPNPSLTYGDDGANDAARGVGVGAVWSVDVTLCCAITLGRRTAAGSPAADPFARRRTASHHGRKTEAGGTNIVAAGGGIYLGNSGCGPCGGLRCGLVVVGRVSLEGVAGRVAIRVARRGELLLALLLLACSHSGQNMRDNKKKAELGNIDGRQDEGRATMK